MGSLAPLDELTPFIHKGSRTPCEIFHGLDVPASFQ